MKIIQIATLVSPDGAYGGPVRVAVNQTRALLAAGHEVILAAGARGYGKDVPETHDGVPVKLFNVRSIVPQLGFSGLIAPGLQTWLREVGPTADAIHIHMGRDLVTLPSALLASSRNIPYVLQTHGMVTPSAHPLAKPVDLLWTKPALRRARRIFYLTDSEQQSLDALVPGELSLEQLHNGVPESPAFPSKDTQDIEVLFLARLQERKRPMMFVEMARKLHSRFPNVRFVLVGPDEGEGKAVQAAIEESGLQTTLAWEGPVGPEESAERISRCDIYVLPSVNEPFPMSVLEALGLGKPVVITDTCGLAEAVSRSNSGAVVDSSLESLTDAVALLLNDPLGRMNAATNAGHLAAQDFGMNRVARQLETTYEEVTTGRAI
jgi:glycosyltransferase involved in cell wall biosynthesis